MRRRVKGGAPFPTEERPPLSREMGLSAVRNQKYPTQSGVPNPSTGVDAFPPHHHGPVTLSRVNSRVFLPMGALKTCCGGVLLSGIVAQLWGSRGIKNPLGGSETLTFPMRHQIITACPLARCFSKNSPALLKG